MKVGEEKQTWFSFSGISYFTSPFRRLSGLIRMTDYLYMYHDTQQEVDRRFGTLQIEDVFPNAYFLSSVSFYKIKMTKQMGIKNVTKNTKGINVFSFGNFFRICFFSFTQRKSSIKSRKGNFIQQITSTFFLENTTNLRPIILQFVDLFLPLVTLFFYLHV